MPISPFLAAINQICEEKGLKKEVVLETIEAALAAAYRKDFGQPDQIIKVSLDIENDKMKVFQVFDVVKEVENPQREISLSEAKKIKKDIKEGETIEKELPSHRDFGRIAAQTAKQVIVQRLREAERDILYQEYKEKEGQLLTATVQQIEGKNVILNLGKLNGIMFPSEQVPTENYFIGQRLKVYVLSVEEAPRGPNVLVSRSHPNLISSLFTLEVPEITAGSVKIEAVAREAGVRSKVAVSALQEGVDPVGSCVGQRGTRISAILSEIGEEKIDIILWDKRPEKYIENALSPAKIKEVKINEKKKKAKVLVKKDQLSLAIGKNGQNVRLASKLTGYNLDIEEAKEKEPKEKSKGSEGSKTSQ